VLSDDGSVVKERKGNQIRQKEKGRKMRSNRERKKIENKFEDTCQFL
jgi:hypothetical protein